MADVLEVAPGYARCLAGYLRAHAAMLDADAAGDQDEREACLNDRWEWQQAMARQASFVVASHG